MTDDPRSTPDDHEIDALGAAPSRPVDRDARGAGGPRRPRSRSGGRPLRRLIAILGAIVVLALVPSVASGLKKTPRNAVGISYGGGPFEAAHFQRVVKPGSGLFFNGLSDPLYLYPADQQNYIVSKAQGEGAVSTPDSIISPSRDRVQIEYQVAVYFKLNIDRLQGFHEQLGLQYQAYTPPGWKALIQDTFRQQIENALQEETRRYDVADLFGNAEDLATVQTTVEQKLTERLISALGQPFFCAPTYQPGGECGSPTFIIKKIEIPADVVQAFQDNRTSEIQVLTAQNQIAQRTAEAEAIVALNEGLALAGMPYVLLRAIESGTITFWVVPSDTGLTLQTPPGSVPTVPTAPTTPGTATTTTTTTTTPSSPTTTG